MNIILGLAVAASIVAPVDRPADRTPAVETPVEVVRPVREAPVASVPAISSGGGGLQFIAQAWDSRKLTWQYRIDPCQSDPNGCVSITDTPYWASLRAQFPKLYK